MFGLHLGETHVDVVFSQESLYVGGQSGAFPIGGALCGRKDKSGRVVAARYIFHEQTVFYGVPLQVDTLEVEVGLFCKTHHFRVAIDHPFNVVFLIQNTVLEEPFVEQHTTLELRDAVRGHILHRLNPDIRL